MKYALLNMFIVSMVLLILLGIGWLTTVDELKEVRTEYILLKQDYDKLLFERTQLVEKMVDLEVENTRLETELGILIRRLEK